MVLIVRNDASRAPMPMRYSAWFTRRNGDTSTACTLARRKGGQSGGERVAQSRQRGGACVAAARRRREGVARAHLPPHNAARANARRVLARPGVDDGVDENLAKAVAARSRQWWESKRAGAGGGGGRARTR